MTLDREVYQANRAAGVPTVYAAEIARWIDEVKAFVEDRVTDVHEDVITIADAEGVGRWAVRMDREEGIDFAREFDCYDQRDLDALYRGDWWFSVITVTYTMDPDLPVGEAVLGGVDLGWYWNRPTSPLDTVDQAVAAVLSHGMLDEARDDAIRQVVELQPAL